MKRGRRRRSWRQSTANPCFMNPNPLQQHAESDPITDPWPTMEIAAGGGGAGAGVDRAAPGFPIYVPNWYREISTPRPSATPAPR